MRLYQLSHGGGMLGRKTYMPMTKEPKKQAISGGAIMGGAIQQTTNVVSKPVSQNQPNPNIEDLQHKLSQLSMAGRKTGKNGKKYISL